MNKIRNKRPRTPKGLERGKRVTLNLTEPEYALIKRNALKAGTPLGTFARLTVLGGTVLARLEEADRELIREAIKLSNKLNELATSARGGGDLAVADLFRAARDRVDVLLNRIRL
jgi:hypothetical protein